LGRENFVFVCGVFDENTLPVGKRKLEKISQYEILGASIKTLSERKEST
jgi:hypothetical protein